MTASSRIHLVAASVATLVAALAAADWALAPAKASSWMIAIATGLGIWIVVALMGRARSFEDYSPSERSHLTTSIIAAGVILVVALSRTWASAIGISGGEFFDRGLGVLSGLVLLLLGNMMPKILAPLTAKRCAPSQVIAIQRFSGWAFVLDGLVCIIASLVLPLSEGQDVSMIATIVTLLLVAVRYAWAFAARTRPSSTTST
jgi:hypothetical protein